MGRKNKQKSRAPPDLLHPIPHAAGSSPLSASLLKRKRSISADRQSSVAPFQTPPTSPSTPVTDLPSLTAELQETAPADAFEMAPSEPSSTYNSNAMPPFSADDIAQSNQEIVAMADLFATMKRALFSMRSACDQLGSQNEKAITCALEIKAEEQVKQLRCGLNEQIERQSQEVAMLRLTLEGKIKVAVEERIRNHLCELVKQNLRDKVRDKVKEELAKQIPGDLQQQVFDHQRQIIEVRTTLHNSEARRYNSLQTSTSANAPLRPLLRPLPTPEQSPVVPSISRSSSIDNRTTLPTPASAYPHVPAPTPIKRTSSNPFKEQPTISALFPADLRSLFALGPNATRQLLREYGLASENSSPIVVKPPKDIRLPALDEEAGVSSDPENNASVNEEVHAADMNKFMAHIGVPFLMIPSPKVNEDPAAPMSSKTRRRRFLTPLIIK